MSILNQLPHTATAKRRVRGIDEFGGTTDTFPTTLFSDRPCFQQALSHRELEAYEKRGFAATDKVYFVTRPDVDERDVLVITNEKTGETRTFEVVLRALPDATAGLGVAYKVVVRYETTGGSPA